MNAIEFLAPTGVVGRRIADMEKGGLPFGGIFCRQPTVDKNLGAFYGGKGVQVEA
jgi:hypothetical protein